MGVGLRPTGKPEESPPNPKVVRAAILSKLRGALGNQRPYRDDSADENRRGVVNERVIR